MSEFWHLNPKLIKVLAESYKEKMLEKDAELWRNGRYTMQAVLVAVEHCLNGPKAQTKYFDKPLLEQINQDGDELAALEMEKYAEILRLQGELPDSSNI